jgi:hypothetical protein
MERSCIGGPVVYGNVDVTQRERVSMPSSDHPGTEPRVSVSYTADPCLIPYALNYVLSITPAVLREHGYEDVRFDESGNTVRARDEDTVITLTAWAQAPHQCSVEITSRLTPESQLGQGPNLRRAERLGEDLAEAAAAMFQDNGQPGSQNASVPNFPVEPERQAREENTVSGPGDRHLDEAAESSVVAGTSGLERNGSSPAAGSAAGTTEEPRYEAQASVETTGYESAEAATAPAGWYTDPWDPALMRWFDGNEWTGYTHQPQAGYPI